MNEDYKIENELLKHLSDEKKINIKKEIYIEYLKLLNKKKKKIAF